MAPLLVLVVEDEFIVRMNALSLLEEAGFDVLEAGSADEAIAVLERQKGIRIVFTDINMPGSMDGLRLAHAIRKRWPPIELVLTSGLMRIRNEDMPVRGLFLRKPYEPGKLMRMVRSLAKLVGNVANLGPDLRSPCHVADDKDGQARQNFKRLRFSAARQGLEIEDSGHPPEFAKPAAHRIQRGLPFLTEAAENQHQLSR